MSYNIGPKIGIDGEKEFRTSIKQINDTYKALEAETRAVAAAFDAQDDAQGKLEATSKQLQKQIDVQKSKMALLEDAVKKATEKFGEESIEATRLRGALYDTQATVAKLENELKETANRLDDASDEMEEFSDETGAAEKAALKFSDILSANVVSDVFVDILRDGAEALKDFAIESIDVAAEVKAASSQFEQTFGELKEAAASSLKEISDDVGIVATRMRTSYASTFAFTKSVGADSEQAMDIANRAMRAAADSAAYYDKTIEEATETLQSFLKGNYANDAALGIAATETTRNAKANELYAASFKDLSEAQKVDVLLAMVEAGNQASGALGQAAREADAWTNVTGEAAEAVHQLQAAAGEPLIGALTPLVKAATQAIYELVEVSDGKRISDNLKEIQSAWEGSEKQFSEASREIEVNADVVKRYTDRLFALQEAGLDTTAAQKEYANVVDILNELMPELNLRIDEQTGLVNKSEDAILREVNALKEKALAQAASEKYSVLLRTQADAVLAVGEAERRLTEIQTEREAIEEKLSGITLGLSGKEYKLKKQLEALRIEENQLTDAIDKGNLTAAEAAEEATKLQLTYRSLTDTTSAARETQGDYAESVQASIDALQQEYAEARSAAVDSINAQIGLFEELTLESDYSAEKIIENWQKQQAAFAGYSENLQKAVDMGLDQALVAQLSDGSVQSMQILDALVNDTEVSIDEINAAFLGLSEGKENLASALGDLETEFTSRMASLEATAQQSGANIVGGLIQGVESRQDEFAAATANVGVLGQQRFNKVMLINSPAKRMEPSGEYTVDGAIAGVENRVADFEKAMGDLALAGEDAFLAKRLDAVAEYPSMVQAPSSYAHSVAHNYGGQTFQIYQQPGESGEELAYRIMEIMQHDVEVKEASIHA